MPKFRVLVWIFIFIFYGIQSLEAQSNLLNNPDMEIWIGDIPAQWNYSGGGYGYTAF